MGNNNTHRKLITIMNAPGTGEEISKKRRSFLQAIKPKSQTLSVSAESMVRYTDLGGSGLPLMIEACIAEIELEEWLSDNFAGLESKLFRHGGILFRGFRINSLERFNGCLRATSVPLMKYMESATPRTELNDKVYTSTEFPPEYDIALHNELSSLMTFPLKIWFCCIKSAERGGETPIADVRKVYRRIPASIRERFVEKGWMLIRNYGDGFGLPWQEAFHMTDPKAVEEYCENSCVSVEWKSGGRLRTRQVRSAVLKHPVTGDLVWFNHISFWHVSSLLPGLREKLTSEFSEQDMPYSTYYGDGSSIEESVVEELRRAYSEETIMFSWQEGDLLMLDNVLAAHGRKSFQGDRKILVGMGQSFTREKFNVQAGG
jgi:alpha-ketoglutarate-dependent taurine dioxygenase